MKSLFVLLSAVALAATAPVTKSGKDAISEARNNAEQRLREALVTADGSVLKTPLRKLSELETAGKRDQDSIATFGSNPKVSQQMTSSVTFWKNKMEEVIKKYINNPQVHQGLVIDFAFSPDDPIGNDSEEYKTTERKIKEMVDAALDELRLSHRQQLEKVSAAKLEDVTASSWARLQLDRLLEESLSSVRRSGQWAKQDAADGKVEVALTNVHRTIDTSRTEFIDRANKINDEYKNTITN